MLELTAVDTSRTVGDKRTITKNGNGRVAAMRPRDRMRIEKQHRSRMERWRRPKSYAREQALTWEARIYSFLIGNGDAHPATYIAIR